MIQKIRELRFSWQSLLLVLFLVPIAYYTAVNLYNRAWDQHTTEMGGADFHAYWLSGHFVRQGLNPFTGYRLELEPELPVTYLDGQVTRDGQISQPQLWRVPVQLAWITFLLTPTAWLSFANARNLWVLFNLAALLIVPLLLFQILPMETKLKPLHMVVIVVAFGLLGSVGDTIYRGQTALLLIAMLLLSIILMEDHPILSGIALGISMSKITVVFPFFLFFLWRRKFIPLIVAVAFQALGLVLATLLEGDGIAMTAWVYIWMLAGHMGQGGIHLLHQFGAEEAAGAFSNMASSLPMLLGYLPPGLIPEKYGGDYLTHQAEWLGEIVPALIVISAGILLMLFILSRRPELLKHGGSISGSRLTVLELELLTIFTLINLLTAHHRIYDGIILILLFPLLIIWWRRINNSPGITPQKILFLAFATITMILLLVPKQSEQFLGGIVESRVPWEPVTLTYGLILALALALVMLAISGRTGENVQVTAGFPPSPE